MIINDIIRVNKEKSFKFGVLMINKEELKSFFEAFELSADISEGILATLAVIENSEAASCVFEGIYEKYKNEHELDYKELIKATLPYISETTALHQYKVNLAVLISLAPYSKYFYDRQNIDYSVWLESILDIKWKMLDCFDINGFYGIRTSSLPWFERWFFGTRYAFHRLQFETVTSQVEYKSESFDIKLGDTTVAVHIPSTRNGIKFDKKNRDISYATAKKFYAPLFEDGKVVFSCDSWLLAPYHSELLPESSNIRQFKEEFEIAEIGPASWHLPMLFNTEKLSDIESLPETSSMQKLYKKRLINKEPTLSGLGYRYFED